MQEKKCVNYLCSALVSAHGLKNEVYHTISLLSMKLLRL